MLRIPVSAACWRAALVAVAILLGSGGVAGAHEARLVDVECDRAPEQLAVVTRYGRPAIRLTLDGGGTVWLGISKPVRQLVAGDVDHDGDIDLLARTDGTELVAWFNHGRGRFTTTVIDPDPPGPLPPRGGPALESSDAADDLVFGIGADGALPTAHRPSAPMVRRIRLLYSSPLRHHLVSTPYGPRAPPAV